MVKQRLYVRIFNTKYGLTFFSYFTTVERCNVFESCTVQDENAARCELKKVLNLPCFFQIAGQSNVFERNKACRLLYTVIYLLPKSGEKLGTIVENFKTSLKIPNFIRASLSYCCMRIRLLCFSEYFRSPKK